MELAWAGLGPRRKGLVGFGDIPDRGHTAGPETSRVLPT